jgi:hypothetical protein
MRSFIRRLRGTLGAENSLSGAELNLSGAPAPMGLTLRVNLSGAPAPMGLSSAYGLKLIFQGRQPLWD